MSTDDTKDIENEDGFEDINFVESDEDGAALPTKDVVKKLREDLKKVRAEKEEYLTGWQRAKADYVNLQKEMTEMRMSLTSLAKEKMIGNFLPALDSFDMAFANKEAWEKVDSNWRTGVEYIYQQFLRALEESGVTPINQVGVPFDPSLHQAIENVPTDDESKDHTIAAVTQSGYKLADRVIRPARVNVWTLKK